MNNTTDDNFNNPQQFDQQDFDQFDDFNVNEPDHDFEEFQEAEKPKNKVKAIATIGFIVALGGIGFAGYQYYFKPMLPAQHGQYEDGLPNTPYNMTDSSQMDQQQGLPPSVTSASDANPVADSLTPPAPPAVDQADSTPPLPPLVADDGTVPAGVVATHVTQDDPAAASTTNSDATVSNDALPAPSLATVESPSRIATPESDTLVAQDMNETIKPQLPVSTTTMSELEKTQAPAMPQALSADSNILADDASVAVKTTQPDLIQPETTAPTTPVATAQSGASTAELQALEQKISDLPSAATIAKLNSQIEALTQRLEALDKRTETLATNLQNQDAPSTRSSVSPVTPVSTQEDVQPVAKPKPKAKPAPKPVARATATQSHWVLRSAQPGAAWLSKPGSEEMVRYAVGQTLPGSGTITAVSQENGRWVLKTDRGVSVRQ
jgi:hypothetical protein